MIKQFPLNCPCTSPRSLLGDKCPKGGAVNLPPGGGEGLQPLCWAGPGHPRGRWASHTEPPGQPLPGPDSHWNKSASLLRLSVFLIFPDAEGLKTHTRNFIFLYQRAPSTGVSEKSSLWVQITQVLKCTHFQDHVEVGRRNAPGWLSWMGVQLLVSARVVGLSPVSGSILSAQSACPSASPHLACALAHTDTHTSPLK